MSTETAEQRAKAAAEAHPDAWIAVAEGDTISGTIIDVSSSWSDQKMADYPLLTIAQDDGIEKKVHCFSTALYNEALRQRPVIGERITITYLGVGEAKRRGQSGAKRYRFRIEGRSAEQIGSLYDRMESQGRTTGRAPAANGAAPATEAEPAADPVDDDIPF